MVIDWADGTQQYVGLNPLVNWSLTAPVPLPPPPIIVIPPRTYAPVPQVFTNAASVIAGFPDIMLYRNGLLQTAGIDYTRSNNVLTMVVPPTDGDVLTARVFPVGKQLGGANPERHIAPWTIRVNGAFDGVSTTYQIVAGRTLFGVCDGVNRVFTFGCTIRRMQVFRNGLLQTVGTDYGGGQTAIAFLSGSIPEAGDIITVYGWL